MKNYILLLLLLATFSIQAQTLQNPTYGNVKLKNNTTDNSATKVNVQSTDGTINTISKADLVNVVEVNDAPSLPLIGEAGKIYVVKNINKIYRWNGTIYQELAINLVTSVSGKVGAVTLVKADVGLSNVDNTTDLNKPISTATQTALNLKANLSGGNNFSGNQVMVSLGIGANPAFSLQVLKANGGVFFDETNATYNRLKSTTSNQATGKDFLITAESSGTSPNFYLKADGKTFFGTMTDNGTGAIFQVAGNITASNATLSTHIPTWGQTTVSPAFTGTPTAPTAAAGTNTTQIATTAFVQANSRPYKVYTALLTQSGTNAPLATVLENTLGGTITWTRTGVGTYIGTFSSTWIASKTLLMLTNSVAYNAEVQMFVSGTKEIAVFTYNALGVLADTIPSAYPSNLEIRVYP